MSSLTKLPAGNKRITAGNTFANAHNVAYKPRHAMYGIYSDCSCLELSCDIWVVYVSFTPSREIFNFLF